MKKIFFILVFSSVVFYSCSKNDETCGYNDSTTVAPASEIQQVQNYLSSNNITDAIQRPDGLFYKINAQGSGASIVNLCSGVTVKYVGKFTNGTGFDSTKTGEPASLTLGKFIVGWQKGLPLINKGGKITLFVPPSLGYGAAARTGGGVTIPANSVLIFDVELVDIF